MAVNLNCTQPEGCAANELTILLPLVPVREQQGAAKEPAQSAAQASDGMRFKFMAMLKCVSCFCGLHFVILDAYLGRCKRLGGQANCHSNRRPPPAQLTAIHRPIAAGIKAATMSKITAKIRKTHWPASVGFLMRTTSCTTTSRRPLPMLLQLLGFWGFSSDCQAG